MSVPRCCANGNVDRAHVCHPSGLGWWVISGEEFLDALRRAAAGEDPDVLYVEAYANSEVERHD